MKNYLLLAIFFAFSIFAITAQEQEKTFMQHVSLDASGGYNVPVSSTFKDFNGSDFAGFRNLNLGANYDLNNMWGLRFTYGLNSFKDKNDSSLGLTIHKFMAEGTFNIVQFIEMQDNPFEVVGHTGIGVSLGKSSTSDDIDKMGTFQVGLMPMYRISNNLSVLFDATYVVNMSQNFNYNGVYAFEDVRKVTGQYFMLNLGVRVGF